MDFAVSVNHSMKIKENEKREKYMDLTREPKIWNMKVMVIPIINGSLEMVFESLIRMLEELEIGRQTETIQTTALLRSAKILKRILETLEDWVSLGFE